MGRVLVLNRRDDLNAYFIGAWEPDESRVGFCD